MSIRTKVNDYISSKEKYFIGLFGNRNDVQPIRSEIEDAFKSGYELAISETEAREREMSEKALYQWARMFESDEECQKVVLEFRQFREQLERPVPSPASSGAREEEG